MALYDDETYSPTLTLDKPTSGLFETPSSTGGIGLAPAAAPARAMPGGDGLQDLPAMAKVGLALQSFGAGMQGKPSMISELAKEKRQEKLMKLQEFKVTSDALEDSVKLLKNLQGEPRQAFAKQRAADLNAAMPGLGDSLMKLAEQPDRVRETVLKMNDPAVTSAFELGGQEAVLKLMNSDKFWEHQRVREDQRVLFGDPQKPGVPGLVTRVQVMLGALPQIDPELHKAIMKDGVIDVSEVGKINARLSQHPEFGAAALKSDEMATLLRNEEIAFAGMPVLTTKSNQTRMLDQAKTSDDAPKTRKISRGSTEIDQEWDQTAKKWVDVGQGPKFKPGGDGDQVGMRPATISVNGVNAAALVDKYGNYYDANTKRPLAGGIGPQLSAEDEKRNRELVGRREGLQNFRGSVDRLETLAKEHPQASAGLFSTPAKAIEYVSGSLNPGGKGGAPASEALQLRDSIVAQLGNMSTLKDRSNQARQRIESALQIGPKGNPKNLPQAISLLRDAINKEEAEVGAERGRPQPGGGDRRATERRTPKKDYSGMSNDELLDALRR